MIEISSAFSKAILVSPSIASLKMTMSLIKQLTLSHPTGTISPVTKYSETRFIGFQASITLGFSSQTT